MAAKEEIVLNVGHAKLNIANERMG